MEILWMLGIAVALLLTGYGIGAMASIEKERIELHHRFMRGQWHR